MFSVELDLKEVPYWGYDRAGNNEGARRGAG